MNIIDIKEINKELNQIRRLSGKKHHMRNNI